ncbi:chemotaxis protein CheY [Candidatus Magnetomorum sp. HK-1]|nr:chemotaxis protein CheY [Candidatus Magnetomorum sp. HK-1]
MANASDKRILVVDDEPDVRNFLAACISDAGFQVETAVDGVNALEKVEENPPDLMTLDMVMPRKSGIRVMRALKENEKWSKIPVIVITAHAKDEFGSDDIKEFQAFATRHKPRITMEKPITPAKLVNTICDILSVEPEKTTNQEMGALSSDQSSILEMLNNANPETLQKIKGMLNNNI